MPTSTRSDRKPPLALRSPIRLRPRRPVQSSLNNIQTPSGTSTKPPLHKQSSFIEEHELHPEYNMMSCEFSTSTKSRLLKQSSVKEQHELRPEYQAMSSELNALTKMVQDTFRGSANSNQSANESPLFRRGKFYEEYSAIRNERLKRKMGEYCDDKKTPCKQYLGVRVETAKRTRVEVKKFESARKMTTPLMEKRLVATTSRYSLRSSCKENKKPPLAMSFINTERRTARKGY